MRICMVTPYPWSQPHEANDHVAGIAEALRRREHDVYVVAPSTRAGDLIKTRRALQAGRLEPVMTPAPALGVSSRGSVGLPVGVRAAVESVLRLGRFDVVYGVDPGVLGLSSLALLEAESATVAMFLQSERIAHPPRKPQRDKLLARIDALLAASDEIARAVAERFPGSFSVVEAGVDPPEAESSPARERTIVVETSASGLASARAVIRALKELPDWELVVLRTSRLAARPVVPPTLRTRVQVRTAITAHERRAILARSSVVVPAPGGSTRLLLEARSLGCALADPPGVLEQPELAAAAVLRLADLPPERRPTAEEPATFGKVAQALEGIFADATHRQGRQPHRPGPRPSERDLIEVDLHMHTGWSHDCSTDVSDLLDHAEAIGLGAIAVTDHNIFGGALEAVAEAKGRRLIVIPGEEVKTDNQGEVIGLFLRQEIPRGMSFADTVAAIREQDGIVYVPHPFDRMHAIPSPETLHRHLPEIDVLEVYNARLLFDSYNDEALRFARKYGLLCGAGSDAHVLQGVGTGALRMPRFDGPDEFLASLRTAEVLRRPKSLAVLQSLKWVAQVKEKVR